MVRTVDARVSRIQITWSQASHDARNDSRSHIFFDYNCNICLFVWCDNTGKFISNEKQAELDTLKEHYT